MTTPERDYLLIPVIPDNAGRNIDIEDRCYLILKPSEEELTFLDSRLLFHIISQ